MQDREKYLERQRRYNQSPKGRARYEQYESTRIRTWVGGLYLGTYRVPADAKPYFAGLLADFRAQQAEASRVRHEADRSLVAERFGSQAA